MDIETKYCWRCDEVKPLSRFDKGRGVCKDCINKDRYMNKIDWDDPKAVENYQAFMARVEERKIRRDLRENNPEGYKIHISQVARLRPYNLTQFQVNQIAELQNWCCCICESDISDRFHIDHNHQTGKVRGLLCIQCNFGLGHFRDSPILLERAITYLKEHDG